jgi:beta-1,4-mannooligosaccharide/beta-1,4-mannosyl-N-acetylglucosamine phosphorylase
MLLDLEEPWKIRAIRKSPILIPSTEYEMDPGYRPNVIFPTGAITEPDGQIHIYYGAADMSIGRATSTIDTLIKLCFERNKHTGETSEPRKIKIS